MRVTKKGWALVVLVAVSGGVRAEPFAGASANWSNYSGGTESGAGFKVFAGYQMEPAPLAFEASYVDSGELDFENAPGATFAFTGWRGLLAYSGITDPVNRSRVWIGGGFYVGDTDTTFGGSTVTSDNRGGVISAGTELMFNRNFGARFEIENFFNLDDANLALLSAGLVFRVGGEGYPSVYPEHRYPVQMPAPEPVYAPPLPMRPPPPAAPPFTSLPQSTWQPGEPGAGSYRTGTVRMPTRLLMSRTSNGGIVSELAPGTRVTLRHYSQNAEGGWWYVDAYGKLGWVNALALDVPRN